MSTPYVRRPVLEGNTDVPVQVQPYLQGTVRKTSAGIIPGFATLVATDAADFVVESDLAGGGPITVTFTPAHSDLLTDIISTINGYLSGVATASERDGCLRVQTDGVGETVLGVKSFIRVYPATNNYLGTGVPQDCAPLFGFACYPDPAATVVAGDLESAATRPIEQGNLPGTRFVARGEDRTSSAFNRGLSQLALNADITRTAAVREAYYPVAVELDFADAYAAGWLRFDVNGNTTQIKLSVLPALFPSLTGRLYVGNLSNAATLREIAKYWGVSDVEGRALAVYDEYYETTRTLRIGAVTRGEQGFGRMYFPDEDSAPTSSIPNTQYVVADGRNALGVSRLKQPSTAITEIRGKTNVVCGSLATPAVAPTSTTAPAAGVGFKSHGVAKGDIAVIASATVTSPFCHNGTYYVEDVVSEQELILRPISDTDVESLNPSDAGSFGEITIYSSAEWEAETWVTLDPPLPRFPGNKLVLSFGIERETLNQRENVETSYTDTSAVSDNGELTAFQGLQFRQRQSLGGAYAGMSADRTADAGSIIKERGRPVTLVAPEKTPPSAGTYVRGPFSGNLLGEGILAASGGTPPTYDDTFTIGDVGRVVKLSGVGVLFDQEPFLVTEFIDGAHVRLAPLGALPGVELSNYGAATYEVYDDVVDYPTPLLTLIAPEMDRDGRDLADLGVLYIREQNDAAPPSMMPTRQHGRSLLHLERVVIGYNGGTASDLLFKLLVSNTATTVTLPVNIEQFQNIFAVEGGDTRPVEPPYNGGSIFRIINGPNAGFYLIQRTEVVSGVQSRLTLRTLDGDAVTLDTSVTLDQFGVFYNAHVSVGHKLAGTGYGDVAYRTAKLRVFFDSLEQGEAAGVGISLDWRGQGAGISAQLNDADFVAYDSEAGAVGYLIDAHIYAPAHGERIVAVASTTGDMPRRTVRAGTWDTESYAADLNVDSTTSRVQEGWAGWFSQRGLDGALLVTKTSTLSRDGDIPVDFDGMYSSAALTVVYEGLSQSRNAAIDVVGSIYQRTRDTGGVDQDVFGHGGIFSEAGIGAGRWVHPIQTGVQPVASPGIGGDRPTTLGGPGVSFPETGAPFYVSAVTHPPDYTLFNQPHNGLIDLPQDSLDQPWSRWVGQQVHVTGGTYGYVVYEIAAIVQNSSGTQIIAVYSPDLLDMPAEVVTLWISGERWERSYLNVADYFFVGTHGTTTNEEKAYLPFVSEYAEGLIDLSGSWRVNSPDSTAGDLLVDTRLSPPRLTESSKDGVGALASLSYASHVLGLSAAAYAAAEGYANNLWTGGWSLDFKEPRTPIANVGVFSGNDGVRELTSTGDVPGALSIDDISLSMVSRACDVQAAYSTRFGGCIRINAAGGDPGTSTVRVWSRPFKANTNVHAVKGQLAYSSNNSVVTRHIVLALRTSDGTAVGSTYSFSFASTDEISEITHVFDTCDILQRAGGVFTDEQAVLYLTLDVQIEDSEVYVSPSIDSGFYLSQLTAVPLTTPLRTGALEVDGQLRAGSFRSNQAVKGFFTAGPARADLFSCAEYALVDDSAPMSLSNYQEVSTQEGRAGYLTAGAGPTDIHRPVFNYGAFFQKGRHSSALTGYSPAFDPFFYRYSSDFTDMQLPGKTGFIVPIDVPHGARITTLSHICSIRPCFSTQSATMHSNFQIWHTDPFGASHDSGGSAPDTKGDWDAVEGYVVTLYRQNCVDFGVQMEDFTGHVPEMGFAEPIWSKVIDLSAETEPAYTAGDMGEEYFVKDNSDLFSDDATPEAALIADRRHYDYFVTIEFFIGCRLADDSDEYSYNSEHSSQEQTLSTAEGASIPVVHVSSYRASVTPVVQPPVMKFRGLRLGWITDRAGDGGW